MLNNRYSNKYFHEWYDIIEPIVSHEEFQKRRLFKHHKTSVWDHCVDVSFRAFKYSKRFKADSKVCSIAGLLHDFYPYAWQYSKELDEFDPIYLERLNRKESLFKKHGFTHASEACDNYLKFFNDYENKKILNAIKRHMFPLNIVPPRYKESWLVNFADKTSSIKDTGYVIKALLFTRKNKKNHL